MNHDIEQRSAEWHACRLGKVTASKISDLLARTRSGWGASRKNYMAQLLVERLTNSPTEFYVNAAMQHGIDTEPAAIATYSLLTDREVVSVGFVDHPQFAMAGASPDGLVGDSGLIEVKCPNTATHLDTLLDEKVPDKYEKQMLFQMACTGREWCDFVSFDPRMPPEMQVFIRRIERDEDRIAEMNEAVGEFLAELDEMERRLREKYELDAAA